MKDKCIKSFTSIFKLLALKEQIKMDIGIDLNKISHEDLLSSYNKTKDFIFFLNNEIESV